MIDEAMELFWEDLESEEVHIHDKWQFGLKSEFFPQKGTKPSECTQEFYLFIPNSLQINAETYSKGSFYQDQTNLIRYKTPEFSFEELLNSTSQRSPLTRVMSICNQTDNSQYCDILSDELKLLANIIRSTLRKEVKQLVLSINGQYAIPLKEACASNIFHLCEQIQQFRRRYSIVKKNYLDNWKDPLFYCQMLYIDEFISYSISHYLTGLLESIRMIECKDTIAVEKALCDVLLKEKQLSDLLANQEYKSETNESIETESILYRYGLLNKFVLNALLLTTNRFSLDQRYQHWIAGTSAGIAMFIYFSLFIWLGNMFFINSAPFIMLVVLCYILKDRIKDWLRNLSYLHASRWFPDFTIVIKSPNEKTNVGVIKESFSFIETPQLSTELKMMRNADFHAVLETVQRPENVLFYKRIVKINAPSKNSRRYGVNIIFRFNIHHFLRKAADPNETHLIIDPTTCKLVSIKLPKVYHLNLIIRSTSKKNKKISKVDLKKFRIIIDKNGIKRIEHISSICGENATKIYS